MSTVQDADSASNNPSWISKSDLPQGFIASSNATNAARHESKLKKYARKAYMMSKDRKIGGGKLGKSTRGWGSLSNNIIQ